MAPLAKTRPGKPSIYVLLGPKGAGKTYLGTRLEAELGVPFLPVEDIWLALRREAILSGEAFDAEGQRRVIEKITEHLAIWRHVTIESTGTAPWFRSFLVRLQTLGELVPIRVRVPPDLCLTRIKQRDASLHIPIPEARIQKINAIADRVVLSWALDISNATAADADRFLQIFADRFLRHPHPDPPSIQEEGD